MEPKVIKDMAAAGAFDFLSEPPIAARRPVKHEIHGDLRIDNYHWLRDKENPEVIKYLEAENAYTDSVLKATAPLQAPASFALATATSAGRSTRSCSR